jgi:aspartate 1-decarboxylase
LPESAQITLLKSKLHHANVTHSELEYEGSCAIDGALLEAANISEYEQIQIYNLNNGERFTTYAIRAEEQSGIISVNGAAAHKAKPGDRIIICTYAVLSQQEAAAFKPTLIYLDASNRIKDTRNAIPVQVA